MRQIQSAVAVRRTPNLTSSLSNPANSESTSLSQPTPFFENDFDVFDVDDHPSSLDGYPKIQKSSARY